MERIETLNELANGVEVSEVIHKYETLAEFLKLSGKLFYVKQNKRESFSQGEQKIFIEKLDEFQEHIKKITATFDAALD